MPLPVLNPEDPASEGCGKNDRQHEHHYCTVTWSVASSSSINDMKTALTTVILIINTIIFLHLLPVVWSFIFWNLLCIYFRPIMHHSPGFRSLYTWNCDTHAIVVMSVGSSDVIPDGVQRCVSAPLYSDVTDGDDVRVWGGDPLPWLSLHWADLCLRGGTSCESQRNATGQSNLSVKWLEWILRRV